MNKMLVMSCSLVNSVKEKFSKKDKEQQKEEVVKEDTIERTTADDLNFYNQYIAVVNKISEIIEQLHKSYLTDIPDPKNLRKGSFIMVVSTDIYAGNLERAVKDYKRSLFDNGELSKLNPSKNEMKSEVEGDLKELLEKLEDYNNTARKVIEYYKNKNYETNLSAASGYDDEMKAKYNSAKESFDKFSASVKKYKPVRDKRDPDKISNPDDKAVAVLMNAYENTLDGAEKFYEKFEKIEKNSNTDEISAVIDEFEKNFETDKNKVLSTGFTEKTKYMKYSYEDYFSKTVNDFIKQVRTFISKSQKGKMSDYDFNSGYDNVVNYYNYMINSYNSSIGVLNSFQSYNF
jgi:6-pyruvoyl-tetrahydropterin synthase